MKKLDDDLRGYVLDLLHAVDNARLVLMMQGAPPAWSEQAATLLSERAGKVRDALGLKAKKVRE